MCQIRGPKPPQELIKFGDVGVHLIEDTDFSVVTTDGNRH